MTDDKYATRTFKIERTRPFFTRYAVRVTVYERDGRVARGYVPIMGGGAFEDKLTNLFAGEDGRKVRAQARRWAKIAKHW